MSQLKEAVRDAERKGTTRYRIAKKSGVSQAQLSRFVAGTVAPRLDTAERIARAIGRKLTLKG